MENINTMIQGRLFELADEKYREFTAPIIPNCDKESIIGVRTPQLRQLAKELKKREDIGLFLDALPHRYHEENLLHGFIIAEIKDLEEAERAVDRLLPYIENWAVCDSLSPKAYAKNRGRLMPKILERLSSSHTYTVRFAIKELMQHFLDESFSPEQAELVAAAVSGEYYINMMRAWYFATALAKQWEAAVKLIKGNALDRWTHNKAIQKAVESYRITDEQKAYLRTLKRK